MAFVPARQCVSVCVCVCPHVAVVRKSLWRGFARRWLWRCSALCSAVCCCWLAGVFCVSVFCLPAAAAATATACLLPPLPAACRMPPAAVSWHVVLALSLGFGLAGWHAGCSLLSRLPRSRRCDGSSNGSNGSGGGASHFALLNFQFQL